MNLPTRMKDLFAKWQTAIRADSQAAKANQDQTTTFVSRFLIAMAIVNISVSRRSWAATSLMTRAKVHHLHRLQCQCRLLAPRRQCRFLNPPRRLHRRAVASALPTRWFGTNTSTPGLTLAGRVLKFIVILTWALCLRLNAAKVRPVVAGQLRVFPPMT